MSKLKKYSDGVGVKKAAEKMEDLLNTTLRSLSPRKTDYHNHRYDMSQFLTIEGARVARKGIGGAADRRQLQTTTTEHAASSRTRIPHSPSTKDFNGIPVKVALDSFEDPSSDLSTRNPQDVNNVKENDKPSDQDGIPVRKNNADVPGRRPKKNWRGRRKQNPHEVTISEVIHD